MKKLILATVLSLAVVPVFAAASNTNSMDDESKLSYALGVALGSGWQQQGIEIDPQTFARAVKDVQSGKTDMTIDEARAFLQEYGRTLNERMAAKDKAEGEAFLAKMKNENGVVTLPDGLEYKVITEGNGESPKSNDTVTVNYSGKLVNGTEFDSSYKRGQPATFPVTGVIPGWTEALQKMKVGSKWELYIPADLAYGERGRPGIPPNSTLIFQVELLSIQHPQPPTSQAMPHQPLTSDIVEVPSAEEMKKGAKPRTIKADDLKKMQETNSAAK
ncbi:MAG TPA: FKBP-type peptidyl-prolyl cis-trans isomerase [Verrucomicrobiae bacterium]|nr:FKBP-type peptidyl-prolyl cis-trans isomerase [Verrucomicrobiae bacterium]